MHQRTDINLAALKAHREAELAEIAELEAATEEDREVVQVDQQRVGRLSRMDALQSQAMAQETERRRMVERARVLTALERIKSGGFGYCVQCDEEIDARRLNLDPAAPNCIDCARRA